MSSRRRVLAVARHLAAQPLTCSGATGSGTDVQQPRQITLLEDGKIAVLTLASPFMDADAMHRLESQIETVRQSSTIRCLVIRGTGRSFCAGANFKSGAGAQIGPADLPAPERSFAMYKPFLSITSLEIPVIAAMNGHAIGGGLGLAIVCDIRVCHASSKYGANFTRLGLHPGMATTYILPRLVGLPKALELLLTGSLRHGGRKWRTGPC